MRPRSTRRSALAASLGLLASACTDEPRTIAVQVTVGHETDAMEGISSVEVIARDVDGEEVASGSAAPGGSLELGELSADVLLTFEVRGSGDGDGLRGQSLSVLPSALEGDVLPVFAQRTGRFGRPPGALVDAHVGGVAAVIGERWLLHTGGSLALDADGADVDPGAADFYDLFAWGGAYGSVLPRRARSIVTRGTSALIIDEVGATWVDFDSNGFSNVEAPEGVSFSLIAGGITVDAPDGVSFVVGGTRSRAEYGDFPTGDVLRVDASGALSAASLAFDRVGAAATWVDAFGLVIVGGSSQFVGAEVLGVDEETGRTLPFPPDVVQDAALVALNERGVLRVGGFGDDGSAAAAAYLDLGCVDACERDVLIEGAAFPPLGRTRAFGIAVGALALGSDDSGELRAFVVPVDRTLPTEVPLREPRRGAAVVAAPNGTLAVMGGQLLDGSPALRIETWFPDG